MTDSQQEQSGINKRKHPRIELPKGMLVAYQGAGRRSTGRISSLSLGGIFISTTEPLESGTILLLVFEVPGGDVRARGTVVYAREGKGMGVQFRNIIGAERMRLAHLLKRLLQ